MDMTTPLHLGCDEARTLLAYPLTTLAWLETTALKMELAPFIRRSRESDRWYLCQGEETFGPVPFAKIIRMLVRGEGPFPVLHEKDTALDPAPWRVLSYQNWAMGLAVRIAWITGCWLLAGCAGFVAVSLASPVSARPIVGAVYFLMVAAAGVWVGLSARRSNPPKSVGYSEGGGPDISNGDGNQAT